MDRKCKVLKITENHTIIQFSLSVQSQGAEFTCNGDLKLLVEENIFFNLIIVLISFFKLSELRAHIGF